MKRIYALILTLCILLSLYGCNGTTKNETGSTEISTLNQLPTDEAKIKDNDAIKLIKSYSNVELGLDDETAEQCSFMVQNDGTVIDNEKYVKVVAVIETKNDNDTYSFDTKGEYFISFDGDTVLKKSDNTYSNLNN